MTIDVDTTQTIIVDEFDDAGGPGLRYITNENIEITIDFAVFIGSQSDDGVESTLDGSTLINNGNVFSGGANGVRFDGNDTTIINNGNIVTGVFNGFNIGSVNGSVITNNGTVYAFQGNGVNYSNTQNAILTNAGEIYANGIAVRDSTDDGATIVNSGLMRSDRDGVEVSIDDGEVTEITNTAGGTIRAAVNAIESFGGRISLDNRGTIDGVIDLDATTGNVNDVVMNRGKITGDVFLGDGDDRFNGSAGTSVEVFGENGDDTLIGGKSGDRLNGGDGNDTVRGGRGKDSLFGGDERDFFDFNSINDSMKGGKRDAINDFVRGNNVIGDEIDLEDIDAKTGVSGNQKFKFIGKSDFHDKKGELRYEDKGNKVIVQGDVNGDGKADFEILVKVGALSAGDFVL
ncbi:MAG: calcium-binding protein [Methyloceanibacter sp.]|uniref:calcium-binding protein n=1 Tax=Methyloceanibacter sp. TaxID=1965321 RepID=UPI003D6CC0AF